jgi:hypothetical protein
MRKHYVREIYSRRMRRITLFQVIAQLEIIATSEDAHRNSIKDNFLKPDSYNDANKRVLLIESAIDSLLAVYPSRYGGEPF